MVKEILIIPILFSLSACLHGQVTIEELINIPENKNKGIKISLELDTVQANEIIFEMSLENISSTLLSIENPLLSLEVILIDQKSGDQVALKNSNNMVLIDGHGEKKDHYETQNKSFEINSITSNISKKVGKDWYGRKWGLLPSEEITYTLTIKYVTVHLEKNEAYIFKENQYKAIPKGEYAMTIYSPIRFYDEDGKIIDFTSFINDPIKVTLK